MTWAVGHGSPTAGKGLTNARANTICLQHRIICESKEESGRLGSLRLHRVGKLLQSWRRQCIYKHVQVRKQSQDRRCQVENGVTLLRVEARARSLTRTLGLREAKTRKQLIADRHEPEHLLGIADREPRVSGARLAAYRDYREFRIEVQQANKVFRP